MLNIQLLKNLLDNGEVTIYCPQISRNGKLENLADFNTLSNHYTTSIQVGYNYTTMQSLYPVIVFDDLETGRHWSIHFHELKLDTALNVLNLRETVPVEKFAMFLNELAMSSPTQPQTITDKNIRSTASLFVFHKEGKKDQYGISGTQSNTLCETLEDAMQVVHEKYQLKWNENSKTFKIHPKKFEILKKDK